MASSILWADAASICPKSSAIPAIVSAMPAGMSGLSRKDTESVSIVCKKAGSARLTVPSVLFSMLLTRESSMALKASSKLNPSPAAPSRDADAVTSILATFAASALSCAPISRVAASASGSSAAAIGSKWFRSISPSSKPNACATEAVVSGLTTVEPSGALRIPSKGLFVERSVPPEAITAPCAPSNTKLPEASVVALASPSLHLPSPSASAKTEASLM